VQIDKSAIRVLIVDDHLMVRDGLKVFLSIYDDLKVVGETGDGESSVELCARLQPEVVLMDMVMEGMDGPSATARIRARYPEIQVIALTTFDDRDLVQRAIQAGAIGYLFKDVHADKLAQAIRDAHWGHSTIDAQAARVLMSPANKESRPDYLLTPREQEVLALLAEGKTNREIAGALFISQSTVRLHVSNILRKLGVHNRTEAATLALQQELV
jgi:NarL family two-component system response regulator LiaR